MKKKFAIRHGATVIQTRMIQNCMYYFFNVFLTPSKKKRQESKSERAVLATKKITEFRFINKKDIEIMNRIFYNCIININLYNKRDFTIEKQLLH